MRHHHRLAGRLVVLALGAGLAWSTSAASAAPSRPAPTHESAMSSLISTPLAAGRTCAQQNDNDNGVGVISQNFEADFDAYDSRAADDFAITSRCTVSEVDVNGAYFFGVGPAVSVQVTFYRDGDGVPGRRLATQDNLTFDDPSGVGNFQIPLPTVITFRPGTYWVAVRANIDFREGGEWGWNTNNTARGSLAQWKNHADGFDTGCTTWGEVEGCLGDGGQGPDLSFALLK